MQIFKIKGFFLVLSMLSLLALITAESRASATVDSDTVASPSPTPTIIDRDIRVVIDVSGSMKKNDPDNHRSKAVQLFSEILPSDLSAGIWTFAASVNMLVKHGKVDKSWKDSAFNKAKKIHSHGLYTNIEKALKVATRGLKKADTVKEQHIILLTDGYVDISKDTGINADSRRRVIEELLPGFQKNHIIIHTIALSEHADHELLKTLSHKTAGQYVVIKNAGDLDRYFFKLFQSTTKPDTVPFKNNSFEIDNSVNDMTIVLFNSEYASELTTPGNETWSSSKHPGNVKWVKSDNYEIITVSKPQVGTWGVDAPVDPDNKIMVVTNLRLHVNKLPTLLMPDEALHIEAFMTEDDKIIKKDEFINLLYLKSVMKKKDSLGRIIIDTEYKGGGIFTADAGVERLEGQCVLLVTAKSPTFVREYKHEFSVVVDPVIIESKIVDDHKFALMAYIDDRVIDKDKINIVLDDTHDPLVFKRVGASWQLDLPDTYSGKKISVKVDATLHNNKLFTQKIMHKLAEIKNPKTDSHHGVVEENHDTAKHETVKHDDGKDVARPDEKPETHEEEGESLNWIVITLLVILANILLGVGGYYIYKKVFKSANDDYLLLDENDHNVNEDQNAKNNEHNSSEEIAGLEDIEDMDDIESIDSEAGK